MRAKLALKLAFYTGLMSAGLGLAYYVTLPKIQNNPDRVVLLKIDPTTVTGMTLHVKDVNVDVVRKGEKKRFWIKYQELPIAEALPSPAATPTSNPVAAVEPKAPDEFFANDDLKSVLNAFSPLEALRTFDKVDDKKLGDFGLAPPEGTMTLDAGEKVVLEIGKKTFGSRNRYFHLKGSQVFLADGLFIENLAKARGRFAERRLLGEPPEELTKGHFRVNGKDKTLAHTKKGEDGLLQWTDDVASPPAKPAYDAFMEKILKLRALDYANETTSAQLETAPAFLEMTFDKGTTAGADKLIMKKTMAEKADHKEKDDSGAQFWVKSQYLESYVRVSGARLETVEKDAQVLFESP